MTFATLRTLRAVMWAALLAAAVGCDDGDDDGDVAVEGMVLVRGQLATTDLAEAQATHDAIAQQGEAAARDAGDVAHDVLLGTDLLDSTPNEFLGIDRAAAQEAHDRVAAGGKQPSIDAGNVGHIVFLGLEDSQRFVAVDIWSAGEPIEPFYSNPMFRQAFEPLFSSVSEPVYQSTDWYQW